MTALSSICKSVRSSNYSYQCVNHVQRPLYLQAEASTTPTSRHDQRRISIYDEGCCYIGYTQYSSRVTSRASAPSLTSPRSRLQIISSIIFSRQIGLTAQSLHVQTATEAIAASSPYYPPSSTCKPKLQLLQTDVLGRATLTTSKLRVCFYIQIMAPAGYSTGQLAGESVFFINSHGCISCPAWNLRDPVYWIQRSVDRLQQ